MKRRRFKMTLEQEDSAEEFTCYLVKNNMYSEEGAKRVSNYIKILFSDRVIFNPENVMHEGVRENTERFFYEQAVIKESFGMRTPVNQQVKDAMNSFNLYTVFLKTTLPCCAPIAPACTLGAALPNGVEYVCTADIDSIEYKHENYTTLGITQTQVEDAIYALNAEDIADMLSD